ncbi:NAD-dependent epimerase/dehydratase family protein [Synechococcus sp. CB0101]|uniref:NAD-dependent epimerase/dehydratase family protein n=1 Tax=Synechococcus sp. CB0101 TaxID=232348 RepID=UPI0002001C14|nr:NAD-dependent epimerase/dehydratase family protein [Synechococcus sp. CB0101]QCH15006.1 NAD-dependent epimerase/dehydratase family protein [Synechococcus sp. CB0101]
MKVFLPGGAGLVGLNLIALLQQHHPDWQLLVVDKKREAVNAGRQLFPAVEFLCEDLTTTSGVSWPQRLAGCNACVMLQAEIGNTDPSQFERNNIRTTEVVLEQLKRQGIPRLVHISSSVVNSVATDLYTSTKRAQEQLVQRSWPGVVILRPTLMFGWFDRKHLGWLARFMQKLPVFPIPGSGRFIRQPLYVGDFCQVIQSCLEQPGLSGTYDITGLEQVSYISLMRQLRQAVQARPWIIHLPIPLFGWLLQLWALISRQPAFTRSQLTALTAGDEFDVIDWPGIFSVQPTRLADALRITYQDPRYSQVVIPF